MWITNTTSSRVLTRALLLVVLVINRVDRRYNSVMSDTPSRVRVIVRRDDHVLMVQHRDANGYFWILPGGGVKLDETLEQAAIREVWEEAGARCRILRRLVLPEGVTGMAGYGLFLGTVDTAELSPSQNVDGEVVHAVAWQRISKDQPIGPLTPQFWSSIAPLFRALFLEEAT